jgi:hypothetical protein
MAKMPAELERRIRESAPSIPQDRLNQLRDLVAETRDLEQRKAQLEEELKDINKQLTGDGGLYFKKLPDLMSEVGITVITLDADGNMPAVEARAGPFYAANIAAGWPPEKRRAAFEWLDGNGHGDLIKTEVTVLFRREERDEAVAFLELAKQYGTPEIKEAVAWNTLTSWLKEQVEEHHYIPPLDIIGGTVARSVKLKVKP